MNATMLDIGDWEAAEKLRALSLALSDDTERFKAQDEAESREAHRRWFEGETEEFGMDVTTRFSRGSRAQERNGTGSSPHGS